MNSNSEVVEGGDPLAHVSEVPDVAALIDEFSDAQTQGVCSPGALSAAEDIRYNRWPGKSSPADGARWQRNASHGVIVRPYDGRPDTDVQLADEIIQAEVDMKLTAWDMAQVGATTTHTTPLTAAQSAELRAVGEWVRRVTKQDLRDDLELLAQMDSMLGWSVLNPGWLERWELVRREVDLELLHPQVKALVLDPATEDAAVELAEAMLPTVDAEELRRVVRDLRTNGHAEFMDRQVAERRPTIRTLIQGYNYFISGTTGKINKARGHLVIERFYQADLEATAKANGWHPEFVAAVIASAGQYSEFGEAMRAKATVETQESASDKSIEIWTTHVLQFDPDSGAAGVYCTTFSPHLKPSQKLDAAEMKGFYAKHYLLDFAHGQAPFVQTRHEVVGPSLNDSRGVPEMVRGDVKVMKNHQDALAIRAQLETNPPRIKLGNGWSKVKDEFGPGAETTVPVGADLKYQEMPRGNPQISNLVIDRVEQGTRRRFALPNSGEDGSHPSLWQMRQMRLTKRWLSAGEEAFWQMTVLCYQELSPDELREIIGRWPQLTVSDLVRHRITLTFDARTLDQGWTKTVLEFVIQLLGIDSGGLMDRGPIIQLALAYIDPTIVTQIMRNPAGAQAALYRQVEQDIASIMDFNPPQLRENDASAGMQLQMAFAVIGKNPKYQAMLQQVPQIQENLKTYLENLQHNVQETQLSPQQGRLGVAAMPERPVQSGEPPRAIAR